MSTPHDLEGALEAALVAWANNVAVHSIDLSAYHIATSQEDKTSPVTLPAIIFQASRVVEEIGSGAWELDVEAIIRVQADDTSTANVSAEWDKLVAILFWDDLATRLTTATLKTWAVRYMQPTSGSVEERHWDNVFRFKCWCGEI